MEIERKPISKFILPIALVALTGVFSHSMQLEGITHLASSGLESTDMHRNLAVRISEATQDAHIDLSSFTTDTSFLRSQPPATRTREDDEKDYSQNDSTANKSFGSSRDLKNLPN